MRVVAGDHRPATVFCETRHEVGTIAYPDAPFVTSLAWVETRPVTTLIVRQSKKGKTKRKRNKYSLALPIGGCFLCDMIDAD